MLVLGIIIGVLLLCFGGVLLFGAPYLPTLTPQVQAALKLSALKKGERLLELGCGDGKVLVAAARKGAFVTGYELNPILVLIAWIRTRKYRHNVRVVWGDFWRSDWPPADVIFVFLLPKYMQKLDTKIVQDASKPVRLVSFAFTIDSRKPTKILHDVYRYDYS